MVPNQALLRYAYAFAIDTNTRIVNSIKTSISLRCLIRNIQIGNSTWNAKLVRQDALEFQDAAESPEKVGWCEFAAAITNWRLKGPIALVVDAHLDELVALNSRKRAICRGYVLPESIELLYGSSDAGRVEYVGNAAIAHCDRISKLLLKDAANAPDKYWRTPTPGSPFRRFRLWKPPEDNSENWAIIPP
jgi:hypothetical protein